jgi:MYXO-CTERM domain-containing protein
MSSRSRLCLSLAAAALTLSAAAASANACEPPQPGVFSTIPADGEKYPADAAVILRGQGLSLTDASVTVDGQAAALNDMSTWFEGIDLFAVKVEPTPAAGQNVVITGTFCDPGSGCKPITLHYEATATIKAIPPPIEVVEYNIHDYPDFVPGSGDCQSNSGFTAWMKLKTTIPDQAKDGAWMYKITAHATQQWEGPKHTFWGFVDASWNPEVELRMWSDLATNGALPEGVVFDIQIYDSAGNNSSTPGVINKPCHYRADSVSSDSSPPPEPVWTEADIYPGGTCESMTTGTGGSGGGREDVVIDGCGCRVAGESESASGLFGALILALSASMRLARRRR